MTLEHYEIGYKQIFPPVEGIFYDMIFAPSPAEARKIMYKIHGKSHIKVTSVTIASKTYPQIKDTTRTGRF